MITRVCRSGETVDGATASASISLAELAYRAVIIAPADPVPARLVKDE
jgi:hypothetical protein